MDNLPDDDINLDGFFEQADEVAKLSCEQQEAWLAQVAALFQGQPELEDVLRQLRGYLVVARQEADAQDALYRSEVNLARHSEQLETILGRHLQALVDGSQAPPGDPATRLWLVLEIAVMGYFLPSLRERINQREARDYLLRFLRENRPAGPESF
jgi:hypothetical protein